MPIVSGMSIHVSGICRIGMSSCQFANRSGPEATPAVIALARTMNSISDIANVSWTGRQLVHKRPHADELVASIRKGAANEGDDGKGDLRDVIDPQEGTRRTDNAKPRS